MKKEKYIEQTDIKVKNLLSELYESESEIQNEMMKTKEKHTLRISDLEKDYIEITNSRNELQEKFEQLKSIGDDDWESFRQDFDLLLEYLEGDKETFIQKAEEVINELGNKIQEIEENAADAASDAKKDLSQKAKELNISKQDLQEKIDSIKSDTSDRWRDIKHWFLEKSRSVKEFVASL